MKYLHKTGLKLVGLEIIKGINDEYLYALHGSVVDINIDFKQMMFIYMLILININIFMLILTLIKFIKSSMVSYRASNDLS